MDGETALHMAARFGHRHAVDTLLEFRPNLEITDNDGWIALHSAVKLDPSIVRAIINAIKTSKQVVTAVFTHLICGSRGVATGWTGVDMSTPLLPEFVSEIYANPVNEFLLGRRGWGLCP